MFRRVHHQRIAKALDAFDHELFAAAECYFGGGTAITLALGEYRESRDIDFLCASQAGYRELRTRVFGNRLQGLLKHPLKALRDVRADQYGIRTFLEVDGAPIKFEIIREARITLEGAVNPRLNVPQLCRADLYAEKLLANADRWADRSVLSRDIIDLAMMIGHWGEVPQAAWEKAEAAYGPSVRHAYRQAAVAVSNRTWLRECLEGMAMDIALVDQVAQALRPAAQAPDG